MDSSLRVFTMGRTLSAACYKFEKRGPERIFFPSLFEWHQCQNFKTHFQASLSLADSWLQGSQHKLPRIFMAWIPPSWILSLLPLVCCSCSLLSWASAVVTPHYNIWLTLYSKFSSFLQRTKFSSTKSCSPHHLQAESWIMKFYTSWRSQSQRVLQVHLCVRVRNALP